VLREDVLPALQLSVTAAARALRVSRALLHGVLAERRPVTAAMALRLGKLFGKDPGIWLQMQQAHDLWALRREMADELARIPTHEDLVDARAAAIEPAKLARGEMELLTNEQVDAYLATAPQQPVRARRSRAGRRRRPTR
jgi:addiction module HigA family antidote